jgi:hypothetical protein
MQHEAKPDTTVADIIDSLLALDNRARVSTRLLFTACLAT